ncbi:aspartate 1-decarboxylase [Anaeromicropila populeti]|uniref:Aspartate 1-decarboxylase n=1 Tax=Anaeromicropila populeti TaxID=37658 RepID=A0A1I6LU87_9FIRM|nr:aspartate 1-decarboxylase [Anaeromicropila populeti]SFS07037.1 L-aspartate 1-decarboxylase [Anaeromicropila populeti]
MIEMLNSKIHRAVVTDANLNYEGSITIASKLMEAAGLFEFQKVHIVNIDNGQRFETYVIKGDKQGEICLNGAAARLVCIGDKVIIMSYKYVNEEDADKVNPIVVKVHGENNEILS